MRQTARFTYAQQSLSLGSMDSLPYAPVQLRSGAQTVLVSGLVDSGATNNVLPYFVGVQLGLVWEQAPIIGRLTGNLAQVEARGVAFEAIITTLPPVLLAFAWTQTNASPVILGQVNFFAEFDVCFFCAQSAFEITPKQSV